MQIEKWEIKKNIFIKHVLFEKKITKNKKKNKTNRTRNKK